MENILITAYLIWAFYSGFKVLSGRLEWLDRRAPLNLIVKIVLSGAVGFVIAGFYLIYLILKFLGVMSRM